MDTSSGMRGWIVAERKETENADAIKLNLPASKSLRRGPISREARSSRLIEGEKGPILGIARTMTSAKGAADRRPGGGK
jgi:hypothetical protein